MMTFLGGGGLSLILCPNIFFLGDGHGSCSKKDREVFEGVLRESEEGGE